jgi:hypothetical protein
MKTASSEILKQGELNCKHYEIINGHIGICKYCGRVVKYPSADITEQIFSAQNLNQFILDGRPRYKGGELI